ncbi:MAG: type I restriction enzyme HsdR N-terminal domain-containing protein [Saprospiraceae bacterium]
MIALNLLTYQSALQVKKQAAQTLIFDGIRRKWLVLQPEELVRQLLVHYLLTEKKYPKNRFALERGLKINELGKRYDVLIYDCDLKPFLLAECKAPQITLNDDTFRQIANYNMPLQVQYLLVTNGIQTYCCRMNYELESYEFVNEIPPCLNQDSQD